METVLLGSSPSCKIMMTADSLKPTRSAGTEQYMAAPQEWTSDRLYSTFHIGLQTNSWFLLFPSADFKSPVQKKCSERSLQSKDFPCITICCRHLPAVTCCKRLDAHTEKQRLEEEPYSLHRSAGSTSTAFAARSQFITYHDKAPHSLRSPETSVWQFRDL